jgi:hypothetical protein
MRINLSAFGVVLLLLATSPQPARAQGSAARLLFFSVNPGAKAQFEEAIKQQMAARRGQNASWRWLAWEYVSGEVPRYCIASFGHDWSDFDLADAAGQAEEGRTAAAAALSSQPPVVQYFEHLDDVSNFGSSTNVPTMAEVSLFQLHYGKNAQFYAALREIQQAMTRAGTGQRFEWFELRSGGDAPQFMLLVPRNNWSAFDVSTADLQDRLESVLGKKRTAKLFEQFASSIKSQQRSAVRLRPDLSLLVGAAQ